MINSARGQSLLDENVSRWRSRTQTSRITISTAMKRLPLGVASSFQAFHPYPPVVSHGSGSWVTDEDGNTYLDMHAGFGANVFGHAHPAITRAITTQAEQGVHFGNPTRSVSALAAVICDRFKMDQVRFCNSGTEATLDAIRLARAATGRSKIVRMEGSYHGHHDSVMVSSKPMLEAAGELPRPTPWPDTGGITPGVVQDVIPLSFNDLDSVVEVLRQEPVACVIIEPVQCNIGLVMPEPGYLHGLRRACDESGTVLIWDEVKTGAVIAWGGASDLWPDAQPHLKCLGKAIGGGLAIGAFGGDRDLMAMISSGDVPGYGTFNGNALVSSVALTTLQDVLVPDAYLRFDELHNVIFNAVSEDLSGLPFHTAHLGAKGGVFASPYAPRHYRDFVTQTNDDLATLNWLLFANHGVLLAPGSDEQWTLNVTLGDREVGHLVETIRYAAHVVRGIMSNET